MRILKLILSWLYLLSLCAHAADVIVLKTGERKICTITGGDHDHILALIQPVATLPPIPISIRKEHAASLEFGPAPERDTQNKESPQADLKELRALWKKFVPLMEMSGSPSGRIGLRLGLLLLETANTEAVAEALAIFSAVANGACLLRDREAGEQGRLRAWTALGKTAEAVAAAERHLQTATSSNLRAEARLTLAAALESELATHLKKNPRWTEDEAAKKERARLYHEALDDYLLPAILPDVAPDLAIRGLWGAVRIHQQCNAPALAAETAKDLIALYPATKHAIDAAVFLASLPATIHEQTEAYPPQKDIRAEKTHNKHQPSYEESNASVPIQNTLDSPPAPAKRRKRSRDGNQ